MTRVTSLDRVRQALNGVFAVGQIVASFVPELTGVGRRLGDGDPGVALNPAAPPGPAFAIWAVLFPAVLAYAVYQAAPSRSGSPLLRRVGCITAAGLVLTTAWVLWSVLAGLRPVGDLAFAGAVAACYLVALGRAAGAGFGVKLVAVPVALMAGWLTMALGVNAAAFFILPPIALPPVPVAVAVLGAAALAGVCVPRLVGGGPWYVVPVAWGLGWVAAGNFAAEGSRVVAGVAVCGAVLVLAATAGGWRPRTVAVC